MISTGNPHSSLLPPTSPALPPAPASPWKWRVAVLHCCHLRLAPVGRNPRNVGEYFCDVPHSFGAPLPEHHPCPRPQVLGILDKFEETGGLVTSSEVFLVHGHNGGCLLGTATMHCTKPAAYMFCQCPVKCMLKVKHSNRCTLYTSC